MYVLTNRESVRCWVHKAKTPPLTTELNVSILWPHSRWWIFHAKLEQNRDTSKDFVLNNLQPKSRFPMSITGLNLPGHGLPSWSGHSVAELLRNALNQSWGHDSWIITAVVLSCRSFATTSPTQNSTLYISFQIRSQKIPWATRLFLIEGKIIIWGLSVQFIAGRSKLTFWRERKDYLIWALEWSITKKSERILSFISVMLWNLHSASTCISLFWFLQESEKKGVR